MTWQRNQSSTTNETKINNFKTESAVRSLVMIHSQIRSWKTLLALAFDWTVIAAMVASSVLVFQSVDSKIASSIFYAFSVVIIACRQHALLVIMHEAAHFRISKNQKLNDLIGSVFAAFPTLSTLTGYRRHHIQHHRTTNTEQDPDWARKLFLPDWQYPQAPRTIARVFAKQFYRGAWDWCRFMFMIGRSDWHRYAYWTTVVATAVVTGHATDFFMYWLVPLALVFPFIQRIRSTSEHFGLPNEHELNGTRNILAGPVETFLLSPHEVNMHLTHHLFPSVPFYNLRKLHESLMQFEAYSQLAYENDSFLIGPRSVLADLRSQGTHKIPHGASTTERPAA